MPELTQDRLKELLQYNPDTGVFTWKRRDVKWFTDGHFRAMTNCKKWNTKNAGEKAGFCCSTWGYILISVLKKKYRAHHLVFLYQNGNLPKGQVDHINHDRSDNRWVNLREVTHRENSLNQTCRATNKSGFTGVSFNKKREKWYSSIMVSGKTINLGQFTSKDDAILARQNANKEYGFHNNHGRSIA